MSDDRRRHRRIAFDLPLVLLSGHDRLSGLASLMDMSVGGILVMLRGACDTSRTLQLRFRWGAAACVATGRVLRVMPMGSGNAVAVQFDGADLAYREFLRYLESLPPEQQMLALDGIGEAEIVIW